MRGWDGGIGYWECEKVVKDVFHSIPLCSQTAVNICFHYLKTFCNICQINIKLYFFNYFWYIRKRVSTTNVLNHLAANFVGHVIHTN